MKLISSIKIIIIIIIIVIIIIIIMTHVCHFVLLSELQLQLNVIDKRLTQKNEEMNILLNYKVS